MSWFEQRLLRRVERAVIARWIERARVAEAIVWWAGVEAEAFEQCWELLRCLIDGK
jgi:hypothetical protein